MYLSDQALEFQSFFFLRITNSEAYQLSLLSIEVSMKKINCTLSISNKQKSLSMQRAR